MNQLLEGLHNFLFMDTIYPMRKYLNDANALNAVQMGGGQDVLSTLVNYGRIMWDDQQFPSQPIHVWFLVWYCARCNQPNLLRQVRHASEHPSLPIIHSQSDSELKTQLNLTQLNLT